MNGLNKTLIGLLVAQVVLIVGFRFGGEPTERAKTVVILPDFDSDKVTALEIMGAPQEKKDDPKQNTVKLSKVNGTWGIADADQYPADATKIDEALGKLGKLKSRTVVVRGKKHYKKLEVSQDKYQRKVTVTQGDKKTTFYIGTSPSFKNTHIRVEGQDDVLLVNEFGGTDVNDRAWAWVDRKYLDVPEKEVWAINIKNKKGDLLLEKDPASSDWAVVGMTDPVDKSAVTGLVSKARSVNLEVPVSKGTKPDQGFDAPLATVVLTTGTSTITGVPPKTTETLTVQIGKKVDNENHYYVKASNKDYVVRAASWAIDPLLEKAKDDLKKKE